MGGVADERRRAGAVNAIAFNRLMCGLANGGMSGQAQIVLRTEIHALRLAAQVVAGRQAVRGPASVERE